MGGVPSVTDAGYYLRVNMTRNNPRLVLQNESISDPEALSIGAALKTNDKLLHLDLSNNEIGDEGAKYLAEGLQSNTTLITLRLDNNRISDAGMQDINDIMVRNNRLKFISILHERESIDFGGSQFGHVKIFALADALKVNSTIKKIGLRDNLAGVTGAKALALALRHNKSLTTLDLSLNDVRAEGAEAFAEAMAFYSNQMTALYFGENGIGNKGCEWLGQMLQRNTLLLTLDLKYNHIGAVGCKALVTPLVSTNSILTTLILSRNNLYAEGARIIADMLLSNRALRTLDVSGNNIGPKGCTSIFQSLKENETLLCLRMDANNVGKTGCVAIADAFQFNYTLESLSIEGNNIGEDGIQVIVEGLSTCGVIALRSLVGIDLNQPHILEKFGVILSKDAEKIKKKVNGLILAELHCRKENEAVRGGRQSLERDFADVEKNEHIEQFADDELVT